MVMGSCGRVRSWLVFKKKNNDTVLFLLKVTVDCLLCIREEGERGAGSEEVGGFKLGRGALLQISVLLVSPRGVS